MKKIIYLIVVLFLTSCFEENFNRIMTNDIRVKASIHSTRTTFVEDTNVVHVTWKQGDLIGVCTDNQYNLPFSAETSNIETNFMSTTEPLRAVEGDSVYAYYPQFDNSFGNDDFVVKVMGNSEQYYWSSPSFYDVLYAKGLVHDNQVSLKFKHLYAFLKITMPVKLVNPDNKGAWIRITSTEKIGVDSEGTFNLRNGEISNSLNNVMYRIPDTISTDVFTCYIAILPQSENAVLSINLLGYIQTALLEKQAPVGGFLAGNVYTLDLGTGVYPEFMISYRDEDFLLCGQVDMLVVDRNDIIIIDHKTNEKIEFKSFYDKFKKSQTMMKYPLNTIQDCNGQHYTLQLSTYA